MSIFDDIGTKGASYRLTEEALYAEALREIESGERRDGIWAKALSESNMDQGKAGAKYIKLRVQSLKDEVLLFLAELKRTDVEAKRQLFVEERHVADSEIKVATTRAKLTQPEWRAHKKRAWLLWLKYSLFFAVACPLSFALSPNGGNAFFDILTPALSMGAVAMPFWGLGLVMDAFRRKPPI